MNVGPFGQTDRQTKLIVDFLNFAKAPKNESFVQSMSNKFILKLKFTNLRTDLPKSHRKLSRRSRFFYFSIVNH